MPPSLSINAAIVWISTGNRNRSSEQTHSLNFGKQHSNHVVLPVCVKSLTSNATKGTLIATDVAARGLDVGLNQRQLVSATLILG